MIGGDAINSGRNPRTMVKNAANDSNNGHVAHLLSNTQSEERVLNEGVY